MKKFITYILLALTLVVFCAGCQKDGTANETEGPSQNSSATNDETAAEASELLTDPQIETAGKIDNYLNSFETQLEKKGLLLVDKAVKDAASLGALEGYGFNINGSAVELYLFDPQNTDESAVANLKTAKESGYITIFGVSINGETPKTNCTFHDNLVLLFPSEDYGIKHPDKETIVAAFTEISQ